ncbi:MAG: site-specific DNA-methyltransferase [Cyanobacteria bacterium MAG CAR1_bin_15]|nr:site-specific DNA-methyltransferase [Cyanobacteria bacterium MAG CAR1_bin_15]
MTAKRRTSRTIETLRHDGASRRNIPTAEHEPVMAADDRTPIEVAYARRNRDLDPQLVWRGKDQQNWSDLVVQAPPLFIQEKIHPKVLINDLLRHSKMAETERMARQSGNQTDLFADFNGLPDGADRTEFYRHEANWSNRMILGDSLQVMASLAEREGLRGRVQCIYLDPPYGIKFNSNFQWSTTSRDVKDGKAEHITREPEQVKAFRDTWRDGIHSYLTYLRDRLTVARDLLTESGSIFVQIGDENVHRVRAVMDEVFGERNFVREIIFTKTTGLGQALLNGINDYVIWYAKEFEVVKYRSPFLEKVAGIAGASRYTHSTNNDNRLYATTDLRSQSGSESISFAFRYLGRLFTPGRLFWKTTQQGMERVVAAGRIIIEGNTLRFKRYLDDFPVISTNNVWTDVGGIQSRSDPKVYVVQTTNKVVERCILMTTDPGDLVLDPTCGSGTTAYVAEQWGRRWITIDTSRVALALARARIMGARYPYYLLADSPEGQQREAGITGTAPSNAPTHGNVRLGFVYERVPHITLKSIANNREIDVIWEKFQEMLEPLRSRLNAALGTSWEEWEIPRDADDTWPEKVSKVHADWWKHRTARQKEIDASIAAKADHEYLYDKPYQDNKKVRVAGPFTVESISPHRILGVDENDDLIDTVAKARGEAQDFAGIILEHLKTAGVQQVHKEDRIVFSSLTPWPGELICAQGYYGEGGDEAGAEKRAAVFIGSEFGTVPRADLAAAAREAAEADFDVLIACAFNYEAHAADFNKLGRIPILKARMNADLHMAGNLKNTGKGNLFVIFGEPDIDILPVAGANGAAQQFQVKINGVDVFHPNTGEIRSHDADGIACWFVDTDYNEESFFVRHAYFLGAGDPYKALKTTLKAEIHQEAWATLNSDTSRPFQRPASGRIAVKVINHLGDEVMKVFRV